jgi:hypothetical protein
MTTSFAGDPREPQSTEGPEVPVGESFLKFLAWFSEVKKISLRTLGISSQKYHSWKDRLKISAEKTFMVKAGSIALVCKGLSVWPPEELRCISREAAATTRIWFQATFPGAAIEGKPVLSSDELSLWTVHPPGPESVEAASSASSRRVGDEYRNWAGQPSKPPGIIASDSLLSLARAVEYSRTFAELLNEVKSFIENVIYPGRPVRIGFAEKDSVDGRVCLVNKNLIPRIASHNRFSYPQTLAAWALIEGEIIRWPEDWDRACDFLCLRRLNKHDRVVSALMETDPSKDPILAQYLKPKEIKEKTQAGTLTIRDLYQHWQGNQPKEPYYTQFISVPVPIIDYKSNDADLKEYGVFNIDTPQRTPPLLTDETRPLLVLISRMTRIGYELINLRETVRTT